MVGTKDEFHKLKQELGKSGSFFFPSQEQLEGVHLLLLEMLEDFNCFAEKHNISYVLSGGCVLGAIRYKGFIPWDDDIDINISRNDFEKVQTFFDEGLGEKYILKCPDRQSINGLMFSQIRRKGTVCRSFHDILETQETCGVSLDFFVMENTFNNVIARFIHGTICLGMGYLLACRRSFEEAELIRRNFRDSDSLLRMMKRRIIIGKTLRLISLSSIQKATLICYSLCKNNHSDFVTIPSGRKHFFGEMGKRSNMVNPRFVEFEGMIVRIPEGYNDYLMRLYGVDYMKEPEEKERHPLIELDF